MDKGDGEAGPEGDSPETQQPSNPSSTVVVPSELIAFTGGTSVAVRWSFNGAKAAVKQFELLRDGALLASIPPGRSKDYPQRDGFGYVDHDVVPGRSYAYRLRTVSTDGSVSAVSAELRVTHPLASQTTPPPTITVDVSRVPDLAQYMNTVVVPFLAIWYPKVADRMARPSYPVRTDFEIVVDPAFTGLAQAEGGRLIRIRESWVREKPEEVGVFLHEATHIVQGAHASTVPSWLFEGLGDWSLDHMLQFRPSPLPSVGEHYENGYIAAAYFLNWIQDRYSPDLVRKLMKANFDNSFSLSLFQAETGKSVDALWSEMTQAPPPGAIRATSFAGKCLERLPFDGYKVVLNACSASADQRFGWQAQSDGTIVITGGQGCMASNGSTNGSTVTMYACDLNGTVPTSMRWRHRPDDTLFNERAGKCLTDPGGGATNSSALVMSDCGSGAAQRFTLPY